MSVKLLVQIITYGLISVLGFFVAVPIAVTSKKMKGFCIMSSSGVWQRRGLTDYFVLSSLKKPAMCDFNFYFHIVSTILYAAVMTGIYVFLLVSSIRGRTHKRPYGAVIASLITNTVILLVTLVSGCIISAGFNSFCGYIVAGSINDCRNAQTLINWKDNDVDGSSFHMSYLMAIICCWLVVLLWGVIVVIDAYPFVKKYLARRKERTLAASPAVQTRSTSASRALSNDSETKSPFSVRRGQMP